MADHYFVQAQKQTMRKEFLQEFANLYTNKNTDSHLYDFMDIYILIK